MMRFLLVLSALLQVRLEWNFGLLISVFFWYSGSTIFFSTPFPCATLLERHHILTLVPSGGSWDALFERLGGYL